MWFTLTKYIYQAWPVCSENMANPRGPVHAKSCLLSHYFNLENRSAWLVYITEINICSLLFSGHSLPRAAFARSWQNPCWRCISPWAIKWNSLNSNNASSILWLSNSSRWIHWFFLSKDMSVFLIQIEVRYYKMYSPLPHDHTDLKRWPMNVML